MKALPVPAFTDAPVIWRHGVRFMKAVARSAPFKTFDEAEAACDAKTDQRKLTR
jgi:hypothetical protein